MPTSRTLAANRRSRGMTLLELILALALSALLLMAISMALHIHWKAFDVRRSRVEEAQLATSILRNISDDIRGTLKFEPQDMSGLDLSSVASGALASALGRSGDTGSGDTPGGGNSSGDSTNTGGSKGAPNTGGGGQQGTPQGGTPSGGAQTTGGGATGGGSTNAQSGASATGGNSTGTGGGSSTDSGTSQTGSTEAGSESTTAAPSVVVGLYGSATQLQFDISRLPRVDQYQSMESADGSVEIPSDIKTIVYFLRADDAAEPSNGFAMDSDSMASAQPSSTGTGRGLMRAESDRAVSAYGEINGSTESIYGGAKLLAAEVNSLQFQYFDGTEWLTDWNSDELGGLPTAIEVLLTIDSNSSSTSAAATDGADQRQFRMVVYLPVGGISPTTEEPAASEMTDMGTPPEEPMP